MGVRREGREAAVQYLYQRDLNPAADEVDLEIFYKIRGLSMASRRFCGPLVQSVLARRQEIDEVIQAHAQNYALGRISAVDRNILRLAIYEMLHCPEVPPVVVINEAIEIAKKYSTDESGKFVNGILDRVRSTLNRPARERGRRQEPAAASEASEEVSTGSEHVGEGSEGVSASSTQGEAALGEPGSESGELRERGEQQS